MTQSSASAPPSDGIVVGAELVDDVLVVTVDNPPVNALGYPVRAGLARALDRAEAESEVRAVVLIGAGRHFIGGADIKEFGLPRERPFVSELCARLEELDKPVVAAVHGAALGGGLEVAVSAHYRVATATAFFGLPEVQLGLLPGSGGTQRVPRLVGVPAALDLMLTGRRLSAQEAFELGLVDRLTDEVDPRAAGLAYARELLASGTGPRPTRELTGRLIDDADTRRTLAEARERLTRTDRHLLSPRLIVDAVEAALDLPFDQALALERALFQQCEQSSQRSGLVHAFFAERATARIPEAATGTPRQLETAGVIGGGTMGAGIALALLNAGLTVTMVERDAESAARGAAKVAQVLAAQVAKGRLSAAERAERERRFSTTTDYADLARADIVIEAVFEDMAVKKAVFSALDRACRPGAILASNTSYLDLDEIAASTSRPGDVIGLHFFAPAHIMRLLEVVVTDRTEPDVVVTAFELAGRMNKVAVRAGVCDGFIGNRILNVYRRAADYLIADGASPYQIDSALRDFGYPMGPFEVSDLSGGDIGYANRRRLDATRDPQDRYVHIADRIAERGWYGQKTGRGWYRYPDGARRGTPDPEVLAIVDQERRRAGITPRDFSDEEILRRYLAAMVNEAAAAVADGTALRPSDVDAVFVHGFGFPRFRGGPMKYADTVGPATILADLQEFAREDPRFWKPTPLLAQLVADGRTFDHLNHER